MRRIVLFAIALAVAGSAFAQKKPKIDQAEKARSENRLADAKAIIDAAIVHEKTKNVGKTWYYRGLLYASIDTSSNAEFNALADNALSTAMESFAKADELKKNNSDYYIVPQGGVLPVMKDTQIEQLWGSYLNKGVEFYQNNSYEDAVKLFTKCQIVKPKDTTGYFYAGLAARSAEQFDVSERNFNVLINDLDNHNIDVYRSLIYLATSVREDKEKGLEYVRKAKVKFPSEISFQREEINLLLQLDKIEEAQNGLEEAIAKEPKPDLYFSLGAIYDELKEIDKAKEAYENAIKLDAEHFSSHFNLAALIYNEAVELIKEKNNLGYSSADQKKAKVLDGEIKGKLEIALPYWEKVIKLNNKEKSALETIRYIYLQLGDNAKASEIQDQIDQL